MTIPFHDIFKRARARFLKNGDPAASPAGAPPLPVERPGGARLSKTVMPNAVRSSAPDPFKASVDPAPNIKLPSARPPKLPPTVALALQPKVERTIFLKLRDVLAGLPEGHIKPVETFNPGQRILLKASEIEKGMATGKPTVSLLSIYAQVPDIFLIKVAADDTRQIGLPFDKVLEQFQKIKVRDDQDEEYEVPQLDTPILQATIEDTERFGTPRPRIQTAMQPPVKVEPATAQALSSAEPESVARETIASSTTPKGIPLNISTSPTVTPRPTGPDPIAPARIPFKLPPNGTGGSDSEKVPASSGPPVPMSTPASAPPARIPFKISAPCDDLKPKLTLIPVVASREEKGPAEPLAAAPQDEAKISLGLREVLQNMPAFQWNGSLETVPSDARIEFPLLLVEPQLSNGRIAIPVKTFRAALPENQRELVVVDEVESPVLLPLQEVLKNLPSTVLKMREDQEAEHVPTAFETPFSIKAAEDAKRLAAGLPADEKKPEVPAEKTDGSSEAKAEKASPAAAVEEKIEVKAEEKVEAAVEAKAPESPAAQAEEKSQPKIEEKLDANTSAKEVVARASALPGVGACSITFEDGLSLAGNLPDDVSIGGLCAMAPSLLQKINRHTVDTKLGPLMSMTLHCRESQMSFFMKGNVCLTVLHVGGDLASETHHQLAEMANELSRAYSQPETVHVDH